MQIALEAMGGDHAPDSIIAGALEALGELNGDDELILFGDEAAIRNLLGDSDRWKNVIRIEHTSEVISMDEQPVEALKRKRKSSIAVMTKYAARNDIDVTISAGNTGAYIASCQMRLRPLPGVLRPGIMVVFPTFGGPVVVCDVGANIAPKSAHLHQYALMSQIYAQEILHIKNPTVGLISIGQEDAKGNELVKKTNQLLREDHRIQFIGNVETREFVNQPCDVVVCDGFVGNIILKLTEGLADGLFKTIKRELAKVDPKFAQQIQPVIDTLYAKHDYNEYGAAPLLGVDGTCMICHGSSDARAIKNAIKKARDQVKSNVNDKISQELQKTTPLNA